MNKLQPESALTDLNRVSGDDGRLLREEEMPTKRVVIVVDDKDILKVVGVFLEQHGYDVLCCAKRALKIMCKDSPHFLSVSVFEKMTLLQAFQNADHPNEGGDFCNQLSL